MMAIYRAWALATAGRDVALFTHSNLLHQYLAQAAPDLTETVHVATYHQWIRDFWRRHFRFAPPRVDENEWEYDWGEMQRECLLRKVGSTAHLVIDEGQNLPVGFYLLCRSLGVGVTVFADENQRIGDDQSTVSDIQRALSVRGDALVLRENLRNSREIAMLASEFRTKVEEGVPFPERSGGAPALLRFPSSEVLPASVERYFHAHPGRSIGIICRSIRLLREIQEELARIGLSEYTQAYVSGDKYRDAMNFSRRPIRLVSTASMKGLEFDSVFVPDLDAYTEDPTSVEARLRFLVLCTRAREDLHLAFRGHHEPAIVSDVPENLLARHAD
ncbi:hypothetical protein [Streptomyces sp. NPDC002067]